MKPLRALFIAFCLIGASPAQEAPPKAVPVTEAAVTPASATQPQKPSQAGAVVQIIDPSPAKFEAVTVAAQPTEATFTASDIRKMEEAAKRKMMLIGMGCGVLGLLLGLMIGRKTAPRPNMRRY